MSKESFISNWEDFEQCEMTEYSKLLSSAAYDAGRADALSFDKELEAFEHCVTNGGHNLEAIEKQGGHYANSRTNTARMVWLKAINWMRKGCCD